MSLCSKPSASQVFKSNLLIRLSFRAPRTLDIVRELVVKTKELISEGKWVLLGSQYF